MKNLKATYKYENISFLCGQPQKYAKTYFILSNYTKKFCGDTVFLEIIKERKKNNIIIPNSIKYIDKNIANTEYVDFETTNNLKCSKTDDNNKNVFEHFVIQNKKYNSLKTYFGMTNIIFQYSLIHYTDCVYLPLKNAFLFENAHSFILCGFGDYGRSNICNKKKNIIFKNIKNITNNGYVNKCIDSCLIVFRNVYNIFINFNCWGLSYDISPLRNVFKIRIDEYDSADNIHKLKTNKMLQIDNLSPYCNNYVFKFIFMYIVQLVIPSNSYLSNNSTINGTFRTLCMITYHTSNNELHNDNECSEILKTILNKHIEYVKIIYRINNT